MRGSLLVFVALCLSYSLHAQKPMSIQIKDPIICYASTENHSHYIAPPEEFTAKKNNSARTNSANIEVTYIGFEGVPQAQQAFNRAVEIWESLLNTSVTIHIEARWTPLATGVLGSANYTSAYANFKGAQKLNVFYPVAIAEKITGREMNGADQPDIFANFSSVFDWHYDPDTQPPAGKYDLTTVVLHELGHGLGFSGSLRVSGTNGLFGLSTTGVPIIYDVPLESGTGANLIETIASPSTAMAAPLTSSALFFDAPSGRSQLYAPSTYNGGSSVSHLDEIAYNGTANALMTPFIAAREQLNNPGLAFEMLKDLGWETIRINHYELPGSENVSGPYTVTATIDADNGYDEASVTLHYRTSATEAFTSVPMTPSGPAHTYSGDIQGTGAPLQYGYYISVVNETGVEYVNPGKIVRPLNTALQNLYVFETGPDTEAPIITHEQKPFLLDSETEFTITAEISDNTGSVTAVVEYSVNAVPQANIPLTLISPEEDSLYTATINIASLVDGDQITYRIKATDHSSNQNVAFSPAANYYTLNIVGYGPTQDSYENNFETAGRDGDFFGTGYSIITPAGFVNRAIHSEHPYISGDGFPGNERNLIYQLRIPIRVKAQDATLKFDEIALVEPGATGSVYGDEDFYDYVVVEGSKDGGQTWKALAPGYDARAQTDWLSRYSSALDNTTGNSTATANADLYKPRTIDLLQSFSADDEIVIRFRLYIDQLANAWGWAIDNLKIQIDETPPQILHNHVDFIKTGVDALLLPSKVSDGAGVSEYAFVYYVNDSDADTVDFNTDPLASQYNFTLTGLSALSAGDVINYRFIAKDINGNTNSFPVEGFIKVPVLTFGTPVSEYSNNFDAPTTDFVGNFFDVETPAGFNNGAIQSDHFYATGMGLDLTSDFTFMLKKPVTLSESNAIIRFDEIALVEGHTNGAVFGTAAFNDYVIVEGSKDQGETWVPFQDGYDAVGVTQWVSAVNNNSNGTPGMFRTRFINMTASGDFEAGDPVLIRFRLFSNTTTTAWGWTIDNLYIQNSITGIENQLESTLSVYPNPTTEKIVIQAEAKKSVEFSVQLLSPQGQKIYEASGRAINGKVMHTIAVRDFPAGMYIVKISNGSETVVRKVIKSN